MKERISELISGYIYDILRTYEDDMYLYFVLDSGMIDSVVLGDLIKEGYTFIIDLYDCQERNLTIAFDK